jgi:hypothetical protein
MSENNTTKIDVPFPDAESLKLRLAVGACRLHMRPGKGAAWVTGTYTDPTGQIPLRIQEEGGTLRITQGRSFSDIFNLFSGTPEFDLQLGTSQPYSMTLEGGASDNELELGGLPLTELSVQHGAGKNVLEFSQANPEVLRRISIGAGAGNLEMKGIAFANAEKLHLDGGAAAFELDFGGELSRTLDVKISTGVSSVDLRFPTSTPASIFVENVLGGLNVGDGYTKQGGAFLTAAAVDGGEPAVKVKATVAVGSLRISTYA